MTQFLRTEVWGRRGNEEAARRSDVRYDRWDVECQIDLGDGERAKVLVRRQKEGGCAGDRHQQGRVISREAEILDQVPKVWNEPLKHTIHSFRDRIYFSRSTDLLLILLTPLQARDQNTFQYSRSGFRMNIDNLFGSRFHVLDALARTLPPPPSRSLSPSFTSNDHVQHVSFSPSPDNLHHSSI